MDNSVPPTFNDPAPPPPPPPIPPPPLVPPLSSRPRKSSGRWWIILVVVLLLVLGGVVLMAVVGSSMVSKVRLDGRYLEEVVLQDNDAHDKVAVVAIQGVIMDQSSEWGAPGLVQFVKDQLDIIARDHAVKAVILKVDSPGGEVLASDDIYHLIQDFQTTSGKPVVASMGGLAASGGYYVSAPCRWIVANELTITGSIGVIMHSYNYRGLMNKVGVRPEVFKSGKFKDMLSGEKEPGEVLPEERQMIQSMIDETFTKFKAVVQEGRQDAKKKNKNEGRGLVSDWKDYADGRVFSGKQALELGFVDELGNFDTAFERAKHLAKIEEANVVRFRQPMDFSSLLHLIGKSETPALKVDLGIDLPKLQMGRLYFLSPTFLH